MLGQREIKRNMRLLAWFSGLVLLFVGAFSLVSTRSAFAQELAQVSVGGPYIVQDLDGPFNVRADLLAGDVPVSAISFEITYDPSVITPVLNTDPNMGLVGAPACVSQTPVGAVACGPSNPVGVLQVGIFRLGGAWTNASIADLVDIPFMPVAEGVSDLEVTVTLVKDIGGQTVVEGGIGIDTTVTVALIDAIDDAENGVVGVADVYDVADNDVNVFADADFSLTGVDTAVNTPSIDAATGEITYAPAASEADGDVTIEYEVCPDGFLPGSSACDIATLTIAVDAVVDAVDDGGTGVVGVADTYDVAGNDVDVPAGADFSLTGVDTAANTPSIDAASGEITYTPAASEADGDVTIEYEVCPDGIAAGSLSCDTATLTIAVDAVVDAVDDGGSGVVGVADSYDVAGNDVDVPAGADFSLTGVDTAANTPSIDAATGEISYTPAASESGADVTIEYEVCPDGIAAGSASCDIATLTVAVEAVVDAVDDGGSGVVGVADTYDVAANDIDVPAGADFSLTGVDTAANTPSIDAASGEITYTPAASESGADVTIEYEVCPDGIAAGSLSCDTATLTIAVDAVVDAVDDGGSGVVGVADTYDVAANDVDVPAGADFSLTGVDTAANTPSIDAASGEITYTPAASEADGDVTIEYEVCPDGIAPGSLSCDTATLTIAVDALAGANDDDGTGVVGVADTYDVAANDIDVPAGADFSLTGVDTAANTPSIDPATGEISYTPAASESGADVTIEYEVCPDGFPPGSATCDTATLTIAVAAVVDAVDDGGSGVVGVADSYDVAGNDVDVPAGADFSLTGVDTAANTPSIDPATGEITYTPAASESGADVTIEYEVCPDGFPPGSATCDTATLTIAVEAVVDAVDDGGSGAVGVANTYDVAGNDVDVPAGADFSLTGVDTAANTPSIDAATGEISYTPAASESGADVTIEYEVCPDGIAAGSVSCDTATLTIGVAVVIPPIDAVDDGGTGIVGVADSYDVAGNDVDVPAGADFSLTGVDSAANTPSIDPATGEITYTPAASESGADVTIEYGVCPDGIAAGSVSCDTATLTIAVAAVVDAVDDGGSGVVGVADSYDVAGNDVDVPAGADFSLTGVDSAANTPSIDPATGEITYTPAASESGADVTIEYEVCPDGIAAGSVSCDTATLTISVATLPIDAIDDAENGTVNIADIYDVASNDINIPTGADFSLTGVDTAVNTPSIDAATGEISYTPAASEADSDVTIEYEVCPDGIAPGSASCDIATLTISVLTVVPPIDAIDDGGTGIVAVPTAYDVAGNDVDVPLGADFTLTGVDTAANTPLIDPDSGEISYTPAASEADGDVTIEYEVCPDGIAAGSASCDIATLTIAVEAVVDAVDDGGSGVVGVADSYDVAGNDVDVPAGADFSLTGVDTAANTPSIDAATGEISYTPAASESGADVTIEYEVCPDGIAAGSLSCDTATLTIGVAVVIPPIDAVDDAGTGIVGVADIYDVAGNDVDVPAGADFSLTGAGSAVNIPTIDAATGEISYTPDAFEAGSDVTIEYEVCPDGIAAGSLSCDVATLTISVDPVVDAVDDAESGSVNVVGSFDVAGNDVDVPVGADFSLTGTSSAVNVPTIDVDTGEISYTPDASESGTDVTIEYEVCPDGIAAGSAECDTATLTISVAVVVPPIDAVDDAESGSVNVVGSFDVAGNDVDVPVGADFSLTGTSSAVNVPTIDVDTGEISYTPDASESGTDVTIEYEVCPDGIAAGSAECDTATLTISVAVVVPPIDAVDDAESGSVNVVGSFDVAGNDVDVPVGADFSLTGAGNAVNLPTIDVDTGEISYTPDASESGTDVTIEYEVCPDGIAAGSAECDTATLTISVAVVVPPIDAVDDAESGTANVAATYDVAGNDVDVPVGADFSLTGAGNAVNVPTIDADTGEISYTPDASESGTDVTIEYEVCPDGIAASSAECDTATLTITVGSLTAVNETGTGEVDVADTYDVSTNDVDVPAGALYDLTGNGVFDGTPTIVPATGIVSYTPQPGEGDSLVTIEYEVCPAGVGFGASSPACDIATLTIAVDTEPPPIDLVNDTGDGEVDVAATYNVTQNDNDVPLNAEFYLPGNGTAIGSASIDAGTGALTYTPDASEAGDAVTVIYEVCPTGAASGAAACDTAVLTITVAEVLPPIDAVDDNGSGLVGEIDTYDVAVNDIDVPADAVFFVTTDGDAAGTTSIAADTGIVTYTPLVSEAGQDVTVVYEVCPTGVAQGDPLCDTAILTIAVDPAISANNDSATGEVGVVSALLVGANDDNVPVGATFAIVADDGVGTPVIDAATGLISYTPQIGDEGLDVTISYEVCPAGVSSLAAACDTADFVIAVADPPPPIQLVDDNGVGALDVEASYDVAVNDIDVPLGADFSILGSDGQGDVAINAGTGAITYTPRAGDEGSDVTITYEACPDGVVSGDVSCDSADLVIAVDTGPAQIQLIDDDGIGEIGVEGSYLVASNDANLPVGAVFAIVNHDGQGTPAINPNTGEITYTPVIADIGSDVAITYEACPAGVASGDALCDTAVLTITVPSITAVADAGDGDIDTTATYDVASNDQDVPAGSDFRVVGGTAAGVIAIDQDSGVVTYTPSETEAGQLVTIIYEVCPDGSAAGSPACDTAVLTITVGSAGACPITSDNGVDTECHDIGVSVWFDADTSLSVTAGDDSLGGFDVGLFSAGPDDTFGTADDIELATASTVASGAALFVDVAPGDYEVRLLTEPEGLTGTVDPDGTVDSRHQLTIVDSDVSDLQFAFSPATLGGVVRLNGVATANVQITTTDSNGNVFTAVSNALGFYEIAGTVADPLYPGLASVSAGVGGATLTTTVTVVPASTTTLDLTQTVATAPTPALPERASQLESPVITNAPPSVATPLAPPAPAQNPLAHTGTESLRLATVAMVVLSIGGLLTVASRRSRRED